MIACFLAADSDAHADTCLPPLLLDDIATILTPRTITHVNDPTVCGYHFVPYETLEAIRTRGLGLVVSGAFTIEWTRESYASQRRADDDGAPGHDTSMGSHEEQGRDGRTLDYSLLERSTHDMPKTNVQAGAMWV